eukprot:scaffold5783_cov129-Amphora_coffeaeformis.AAC.13
MANKTTMVGSMVPRAPRHFKESFWNSNATNIKMEIPNSDANRKPQNKLSVPNDETNKGKK